MRKGIITQVFAVTAILAMMVSCAGEPVEKEEVRTFLPLVTLQKAVIGDFEHKINVQGNVETDQEVILNAEMGGQVNRVLVNEGQEVSKGQTLMILDDQLISSNITEIKSQLDYAVYMLGKQQELQKIGLGSELDLETSKSQVNSLKTKLNSIQIQKQRAAVKAPFSGVIDKVFAKNGEMVGQQSPLLRMVNNNSVYLSANISEKHLNAIRSGTQMEVRFPNYTDTIMRMKVGTIGNYIEPANRTFRIRANILKNTILIPNMLAEIQLTDYFVKDALTIPSKSIIKDQNNNDFVYTVKGKGENRFEVSKANVKVLSKYNSWAHIEVLEGKLVAGTQIVVEGAKGVTEKDIVRIK